MISVLLIVMDVEIVWAAAVIVFLVMMDLAVTMKSVLSYVWTMDCISLASVNVIAVGPASSVRSAQLIVRIPPAVDMESVSVVSASVLPDILDQTAVTKCVRENAFTESVRSSIVGVSPVGQEPGVTT